jgi:trans-2,3-dihydro-3-hydroxyanthranilate isomerase
LTCLTTGELRGKMGLSYETVDVFTDRAFGGNPLAVVFGAEALSSGEMLSVCREFKYSETTFVLPPADPSHTARVRIFTEGGEVPFAGHPNVGTATVLAWRGELFGRTLTDRMVFEEDAGLVTIRVQQDEHGQPCGAQLVAPQAFTSAEEIPVATIADALGLAPEDIDTSRHAPVIGSVGLPFVLCELASRDALGRAGGDMGGFARAAAAVPAFATVDAIHAYWRADESDTVDVRARMHCGPVMGGFEDPATGSANCALMGLLAQLEAAKEREEGVGGGDGGDSQQVLRLSIAQGVEMGRPSMLTGEADYVAGGAVGAVRMAGTCVAMMRGKFVGLAASSHVGKL